MDYTYLTERRWKKIAPKLFSSRNTIVQADLLRLSHCILTSVRLRYWLADGALLCIYRNKKLLKHNRDIDLLVKAEDLPEKIDELKLLFIEKGCDVRAWKRNTRFNAYLDNEVVSIQGYIKKGKYRIKKNRYVPEQFFGNDTIEFDGIDYPCVSPIEKFLSWRYTNWKKEYTGNPDKRKKYINQKKIMRKR